MENNTNIYKPGKWLIVVTNNMIHIILKGTIGNHLHYYIPVDEITKTEFKRKWLNGGFKLCSTGLNAEFYNINKTDLNNFEQALIAQRK